MWPRLLVKHSIIIIFRFERPISGMEEQAARLEEHHLNTSGLNSLIQRASDGVMRKVE